MQNLFLFYFLDFIIFFMEKIVENNNILPILEAVKLTSDLQNDLEI